MASKQNQDMFYEQVKKSNPKLGLEQDDNLLLVVIGYPHCPYSIKSKQMIASHKEYNDKHRFIHIEPASPKPLNTAANFRDAFSYDSSFPVIFIRKNDDLNEPFEFLGGSDELKNHMIKNNSFHAVKNPPMFF
jgi:hypothetical protein